MEKQPQHLRDLATAKYAEVVTLDHGTTTGRRLQLASSDMTAEKLNGIMTDQFADIAKRLGADFFSQTPAVALEQFAIMAIIRKEDTAGLLKSLINSFMIAYLTPETADRAFLHLVGLEALRAEVSKTRSTKAYADAQTSQTLKAYQVGDTDIVAAYDPDGARKVLCEFNGYPEDEYADSEIVLVSDKLLDNTEAFDQGEGQIVTLDQTLRQELAELTEPAYLHGWE